MTSTTNLGSLRRPALAGGILLLAIGLFVLSVRPTAAANSNKVYPPNSNPHGKSYGSWGFEWWQWMGQYPYAQNPITDAGPNVEYGDADEQPAGSVWFLAGTFGGPGERNLTVPTGKSLLFPIINWDVWSPEDCWWIGASMEPDACTNADLQAWADGFFPAHVTAMTASLDGESLGNPYDFRASSGDTTLNIVAGDLFSDFGYAPGPRHPNHSDGYYMMLKPLTPGEHLLHWTGAIDGSTNQDMTYHLTVVPGN